jgi:serine/threonine-protein kinase RsbW
VQAAVNDLDAGQDDPDEAVRWKGDATPEAVGLVRQLLVDKAARLGAARDLRDRVALAVSEAVSNVVVHAYREIGEPGEVTVVMERRAEQLEILVRDRGVGLVPRPDSPGLGLGIGLMAQTADTFDILTGRGDPGVEVRLGFALSDA